MLFFLFIDKLISQILISFASDKLAHSSQLWSWCKYVV